MLDLLRIAARLVAIAARAIVWLPAIAVAALLRLEAAPRLLRRYLQANGGLFVKGGQILALRYDLLPMRWCAELAKLLDGLPPVPTAAIKRVIAASLGKPVGELFATFEEQALSCASVAQVHGATLANGEAVVVKVVRPGAEILFNADLLAVGAAAATAELLGFGVRLGLRRLARELAVYTREELDLLRELRNAELLEARFAEDGVPHAVPRTYPALCARSVLTMERIDGVSLARLVTAVEDGDALALEDWRRQGIEVEAVASLLLRSMLVQMFRHRTFHADPHSANIFVRPGGLARRGGELVFVDFGIFGWLDERQWAQQIRMRQALSANRIHAAYVALVADFTFPRGMDVAAFEADVKEILWSWSQASLSPHATIQDKSAGTLFLKVFDVVRRAGAGIPAGLTRLFRALVISDMVILKLNPAIDILAEVRGFLTEEMRLIALQTTARHAAAAPAAIARFAAEAPEAALEALEWLAEQPGARPAPRPEPAPSAFARLVFRVGAAASAVVAVVAGGEGVFGRVTALDAVLLRLGVDAAGHPGTVVVGSVCAFVVFRRLGAAFAR